MISKKVHTNKFIVVKKNSLPFITTQNNTKHDIAIYQMLIAYLFYTTKGIISCSQPVVMSLKFSFHKIAYELTGSDILSHENLFQQIFILEICFEQWPINSKHVSNFQEFPEQLTWWDQPDCTEGAVR